MQTVKGTLSKVRWLHLIPIAFITYSLAYLDRANYGFGAAAGMAKDLGITSSISSLLGALFFLGYFFFQIPGAHYAEKKSAKKLVFWALILWGGLAAATGFINDVGALAVIRFMLGVVESVVFPAMLVFLSHWFTKKERSRANTFLILGNPVTVLWMSILSGYLVSSLGWRWMFIIEGLPAVVWALFWWKLVKDRPSEVGWLTNEEKKALEDELQLEQTGLTPVKNYREAFRSATVIKLSLQYFFWSLGLYGFVMWLPSIIKAAPNMSMVSTGWLSSVPYVLAVIAMLLASFLSDKTLNRKIFVWPFLLLGAIAFYASFAIGTEHFWISYILLIIAGGAMYAPYGPFFAIIPEILPRNVAGGAMALINSMGALGSFLGSYFVGYLNGVTGGFGASYLCMAGALLLSSILTLMVSVKAKEKAAESNMGVKTL
ncbi:MFS transporter [Paenibacillus filicis]|uniref:MFS transporter n=1 Tax=Paenibacillus gyeongsangnamensis TaxID=3388067 RepID=A0ABT4QC93_9BACL|nr:MFS transporter [Paenibacillus filicis]MCZ8514481.1 MFS transporter [Paenibacillus filicis]